MLLNWLATSCRKHFSIHPKTSVTWFAVSQDRQCAGCKQLLHTWIEQCCVSYILHFIPQVLATRPESNLIGLQQRNQSIVICQPLAQHFLRAVSKMEMFHEFNRFKKGLIWYVYTFHKSRKIGYIWLALNWRWCTVGCNHLAPQDSRHNLQCHTSAGKSADWKWMNEWMDGYITS